MSDSTVELASTERLPKKSWVCAAPVWPGNTIGSSLERCGNLQTDTSRPVRFGATFFPGLTLVVFGLGDDLAIAAGALAPINATARAATTQRRRATTRRPDCMTNSGPSPGPVSVSVRSTQGLETYVTARDDCPVRI